MNTGLLRCARGVGLERLRALGGGRGEGGAGVCADVEGGEGRVRAQAASKARHSTAAHHMPHNTHAHGATAGVLCCAVLCCAVLCGAVLCGAVLCCAVRCGAVRCGAVRCCAVRCENAYIDSTVSINTSTDHILFAQKHTEKPLLPVHHHNTRGMTPVFIHSPLHSLITSAVDNR